MALCLLAKPCLLCAVVCPPVQAAGPAQVRQTLSRQNPSWEGVSGLFAAGVALTQSPKLPVESSSPFPHPTCSRGYLHPDGKLFLKSSLDLPHFSRSPCSLRKSGQTTVKNLVSGLLEHGMSFPRLVKRRGKCFPGAASVPYEWIWCYPAVPPEQTSGPAAILAFFAQQNEIIAALCDVHVGKTASQQLLIETQIEGQLSCVSVLVGSEVSTLPVAIFHLGK